MRLRVAASLAFVLASLRVVASCTETPIVVGSVPPSDAGTSTAPQKCLSISDCPQGTFCSKDSCSADEPGSCELFPAYCAPDETPYCGCDQITYFNDCLRKAAGVAFSTSGECTFDNATPCGGSDNLDCPDASQCAQLLGSKVGCPDDLPGTCWVLPATCPTPAPGADRWNSCSMSPNLNCVDTCTAISNGGVYRRAPPCSPPPSQ